MMITMMERMLRTVKRSRSRVSSISFFADCWLDGWGFRFTARTAPFDKRPRRRAGATNHGDASGRRTPRPNRTKKGENAGEAYGTLRPLRSLRSLWKAACLQKTERVTPQSVSTDLIISFYCRQINKMMKKREFISTGAPFLAKPAPVCYNNR